LTEHAPSDRRDKRRRLADDRFANTVVATSLGVISVALRYAGPNRANGAYNPLIGPHVLLRTGGRTTALLVSDGGAWPLRTVQVLDRAF
jgi:hypothetical protein